VTELDGRIGRLAHRLFAPSDELPSRLWPRWIFLRALGLIFFSAFYSLYYQIRGLIGEQGILPAGDYLHELAVAAPGLRHVLIAPTLFWFGSGDRALMTVVIAGAACSLLLVANVWPRLTTAVCTALFLSCIAALQDFSSYQSDGMLLEAGFLSIFFAPRGIRPGIGAFDPPSRASLFLLQWEWFRIYFESGMVKLLSGDVHWRNLTAMDNYYENGPLPAWPGWYVQQLPHWYHAGTVVLTLLVELVLVWALFLPRRFRVALFLVVTALQVGIIATANYAFLNYLVLVLGVLLLDDAALEWLTAAVVRRFRARAAAARAIGATPDAAHPATPDADASIGVRKTRPPNGRTWRVTAAIALTVVFYATIAPVVFGGSLLLSAPARWLEPFRIANQYGLFAVMTEHRYEIEFQGTSDGKTWIPYPFRYKPQDPHERPGIYAPYQPRFEWNLWFASLGPWRQSPWVVLAQARLLDNSAPVVALFRSNPFATAPPTAVRTVLWQYWFTDRDTKRATGLWWQRRLLGPYAGAVSKDSLGRMVLGSAP
jgi:hypothetical protein